MLICFNYLREGVDLRGYNVPYTSSPSPHPSFSPTPFTHVLSFDQDKMKVVNEVPIEAQRSYVAAREQIQELTKSELKEKEELKESEEEKSELKVIDLDEEAERLIETCEEYETVIAEMDNMVQTLLTKIETKGNVRYVTSTLITKYVDPVIKAGEAADSLKENIEEAAERKEISEEIVKQIEEIDESMVKIDPKESIIDDAIERIENDEKIAIREGSRIAALSDLEEILQKDAELIKEKAFEDTKDKRIERIESAEMIIDSLIESVERMKEKSQSFHYPQPLNFIAA